MQGRPTQCCSLNVQLGANARVAGGHVVHALKKCLEVEHGAPHQQGQGATAADVGNQLARIAGEFGGAVSLQWVADVDQVVWYLCQLFFGGFGGANVHAAVHQGRVHAHDFARPARGQCQSRRCFAAGGRAGNGNIFRGNGRVLGHRRG